MFSFQGQPGLSNSLPMQATCTHALSLQLHSEVCSLQECTPCDADFTACHQIIAQINSLVKSGLCNQSGMRIEPYGSFQSKLHFPTGDLDLSIEGTYTRL